MKLVSVIDAEYNKSTNTLTARFKNAENEIISIEIDGLAFAHLMGLANIQNSIANHIQAGKEMPWLQVAGLQTGSVSTKELGYILGISLLVPQIGLLNFALPPEVETALRDKLKIPPSSKQH